MRGTAAALCLVLAGCGDIEPKVPGAEKESRAEELAQQRRLKRACGSQETYDRLKAVAFDDAVRVRKGPSPVLDQLQASAVIRMEQPVVKSRDEELNVTVCTGHLVLELPPGAEDAFDGDRRLEADVEYTAQEAADGSGLVYQIKGAEPIVYRLAALDMSRPLPGASPTAVAAAPPPPPVPVPAPAPPPVRAEPAPQPPPRVAPPPREAPRPVPTVAPLPRQARPAPPPRPAPDAAPPVVRQAAVRPSFNCAYARSRVERLVCSDAELARADRRMSAEFYAALANADPDRRAALRASRDRFLRYRDRCGEAGCVAQAYADRVDEIRDIAGGR